MEDFPVLVPAFVANLLIPETEVDVAGSLQLPVRGPI